MGQNKGVALPERMKRYEASAMQLLSRRTPVIIRVDGKAFHTLTRGCDKPFDERFSAAMVETAMGLCEEIQGAQLAYIQSDEISVLIIDYQSLQTQAWFDYELPKILSISAARASVTFSGAWGEEGLFDSRAFNVPREDVCNYFVWRQRDCIRNSIMGLAQAHFSHKQLQGASCDEAQEMLFQEQGVNWNDCHYLQKRGACMTHLDDVGWALEDPTPEFSSDREYVEKYLYLDEEQEKA